MANELQKFMVPDTTWAAISSEITTLRERIANQEELEPQDVVKVQTLVKQVEEFGKGYSKEVNNTARRYKTFLSKKLEELGYSEISNYVANRKRELDRQTNARMADKMAKLTDIVHKELEQHPVLNSTGLKETMVNLFIGRFPKMNSGAISNEIRNWKPIESVIKTQMDKAEEVLKLNPAMLYLPVYSQTFQTLASYLRTGDVQILATLPEVFKGDADLLRNVVIKQQMQTTDDLLNLIQGVMSSQEPSDDKLQQIKQLILIWDTI